MSRRSESEERKKYLHGKTIGDGVLEREFKYDAHDDTIVSILKQRDRKKILERNQRLRNNESLQKDLSWGRMVASIPFEDFEVLKHKYPELANEAHPDHQKVLMRVLNSPEGFQYRLRGSI